MAIEFDGIDDYIDCGTADILQENAAITVYARINATDGGGSSRGRIVFRRDATGTSTGFNFQVNSLDVTAGLEFIMDGSVSLNVRTNSNAIVFGNNHSVLMTWDGSTTATNVHIYVDGSEQTYALQANGTLPSDTVGQTMMIGNRESFNRGFKGIISEVAIFNNVVSSTSISLLTTSKIRNTPLRIPGCVRYWRMDDQADDSSADGDSVTDITAGGNGTGNDGANNTGLLWRRETQLVYANALQRGSLRGVMRGVAR